MSLGSGSKQQQWGKVGLDLQHIEVQHLSITIEGKGTRNFRQINPPGVQARCLWRAVAQGWYNNPNRAEDIIRRTNDHWVAATSNAPRYQNNPLQTQRSLLYESMQSQSDEYVDTSYGSFLERLATGNWGKTKHPQSFRTCFQASIC